MKYTDDDDEIKRLLNLKIATHDDKVSALSLVRKYVNEGYNICFTCAPQIRQMFSKLNDFWISKTKEV